MINLDNILAIDVHTHAEVSCRQPQDDFRPELDEAFAINDTGEVVGDGIHNGASHAFLLNLNANPAFQWTGQGSYTLASFLGDVTGNQSEAQKLGGGRWSCER